MPAVSKGDGMRGLAVFISDIRNCEWRLRRGGAGAWAGPAVAPGRCPVGPGLLSFDPLLNARLFPLLPPQQAARSAPASRNGDAPWGAAGEAARGGGGGGGNSLSLLGCGFGLVCAFWVGWFGYLPLFPLPAVAGACWVLWWLLRWKGVPGGWCPPSSLFIRRSRCVLGVRVALWWAGEKRLVCFQIRERLSVQNVTGGKQASV